MITNREELIKNFKESVIERGYGFDTMQDRIYAVNDFIGDLVNMYFPIDTQRNDNMEEGGCHMALVQDKENLVFMYPRSFVNEYIYKPYRDYLEGSRIGHISKIIPNECTPIDDLLNYAIDEVEKFNEYEYDPASRLIIKNGTSFIGLRASGMFTDNADEGTFGRTFIKASDTIISYDKISENEFVFGTLSDEAVPRLSIIRVTLGDKNRVIDDITGIFTTFNEVFNEIYYNKHIRRSELRDIKRVMKDTYMKHLDKIGSLMKRKLEGESFKTLYNDIVKLNLEMLESSNL